MMLNMNTKHEIVVVTPMKQNDESKHENTYIVSRRHENDNYEDHLILNQVLRPFANKMYRSSL